MVLFKVSTDQYVLVLFLRRRKKGRGTYGPPDTFQTFPYAIFAFCLNSNSINLPTLCPHTMVSLKKIHFFVATTLPFHLLRRKEFVQTFSPNFDIFMLCFCHNIA